MKIAIDGPAGAGKSTVSDELARRLGIVHLDTGAMYRAVALSCKRKGIDIKNEAAVTDACKKLKITINHVNGRQQTILDGEDVSEDIRDQDIGAVASLISTYSGVRSELVTVQQNYASGRNIVIDGRDIGTRVLTDADIKFFLTASPEQRACRRTAELQEKGISATYEDVLISIQKRDMQDTSRKSDPLRCASDAIVIDTTNMSMEESINTILNIINERLK